MTVATLVLAVMLDPGGSGGLTDCRIGGWLPRQSSDAWGGYGVIGDIVVGV
jgi:hypothetical protein